jgi:hypothetical protein
LRSAGDRVLIAYAWLRSTRLRRLGSAAGLGLAGDGGREGLPLLRRRGSSPTRDPSIWPTDSNEIQVEQLDDLRDRERVEEARHLGAADRGVLGGDGLREGDREVPSSRPAAGLPAFPREAQYAQPVCWATVRGLLP